MPDIDRTYGGILKLAGPLILTTSGFMVMQFIDALFLSWYSPDAVAAAIPAGMASWLLIATFQGAAGYTSTFVAQYAGAGRTEKVAATVWQGIYLSIIAGAVTALFGYAADPLFNWVGHSEPVRTMESIFFTITCWGAVFAILANAISGFFTGRDDTRTIMYVQCLGLVVNGVLDYLLIFGKFNFPRMGITGAAIATVSAQAVIFFAFFVIFLCKKYRDEYGTWKNKILDLNILKRLIQFGFPNGMRFSVEILAWTMFTFFVGRISQEALVETSIAWRINGIAFFPVIGLSQAISILVGNAQGAKKPEISKRITYKGLLLAEIWMIIAGVAFIVFPRELYGLFYNPGTMTTEYFGQISDMGVILLRLVAIYCLMDAFNIVIVSTLLAAGDTRWSFIASLIMHLLFLSALCFADYTKAGLMIEWYIATIFVLVMAFLWLVRFRMGKWKAMEVIEIFE
jgi:multidrug resistance protein, MATE family